MKTLTLKLDRVNLTDEQFYNLCLANPDRQLERNSTGDLIVMSPVGGVSGNREADFLIDLGIWNRQTGLGKIFSSSTIFRLPQGGDRSPDAAWVSLEKWQSLSREDQEKFPPLCPDFVLELRSRTDRLDELQAKMEEYLASGLRLGWLINPQDQTVEIYRPKNPVEIKTLPTILNGENVLPEFSLQIARFDEV
ncbi:Uma2 family endonuclease [Synechocystis sp. FACHB-383]|uniref:Uma2 family endonuclease n=1 Tax=Synechocystis sp. FACHB-383 TaxID=2692864 RepID=UPI001682E317|nr:Uma2 family endonuclease [Synechocystis sp. FACHB-383]MBD2654778.1 Uma2 family endonuclease [Synechocystis sp. FACHB-383]